jgi:hypothetical protein
MNEQEGGTGEGGLPANPAMTTPSADEPDPSLSPESELGGGTSEAGLAGGRGDLGGGGGVGGDAPDIDPEEPSSGAA